MIAAIKAGAGASTAGEFLTQIMTHVFSDMGPFVKQLERCVETLEEAFETGDNDDVIMDAALIRRRGAIYLRHIAPHKEILERLQTLGFEWLSDGDKENLLEAHDKVIRYTELLSDLGERTRILNQELRSQQADRLNRTTYLFSVAATIFLPLSFLTELMGINVGGIPGADTPSGFWFFFVVCVVLVVAQIILFRRKRWF